MFSAETNHVFYYWNTSMETTVEKLMRYRKGPNLSADLC